MAIWNVIEKVHHNIAGLAGSGALTGNLHSVLIVVAVPASTTNARTAPLSAILTSNRECPHPEPRTATLAWVPTCLGESSFLPGEGRKSSGIAALETSFQYP